MKQFFTALKLFLLATVITGIVYPLVVTGVAQLLFKDKADGSLVLINGKAAGSRLIAQKFDKDGYFWPRPSATDFNPMPSGASNLSATSKQLRDMVEQRRSLLIKSAGAITDKDIPSDLLYASGSGLDPDISPAAARFQIDRILKARKLGMSRKADIIVLINNLTRGRDLKVLGEQRVNVLELNIALDNMR